MWALEKLKLDPNSCIAIEHAPRGVESAVDAGLKVIVTPSIYTKDEDFDKASLVISDLGEPEKPFKVLYGNSFEHSYMNIDLLKKIHLFSNK